MVKRSDLEELVVDGGSFFSYLCKSRPDLAVFSHAEVHGGVSVDSGDYPHGTTIIALKYGSGVVIGSDKQVTAGHTIMGYMEKVFDISSHCAIAVSGTVSVAQDIADYLRVEVTHYEKINHTDLSASGTANTLARMIKANRAAAMQGFVCVPILAAYDSFADEGKVFSYDALGSMFDSPYETGGSGGEAAKSTLQKRWRPNLDEKAAVDLAIECLDDAGRKDTGTTSLNMMHGIYPIIKVIDSGGVRSVPQGDLKMICERILQMNPPPLIMHGK
jgi:proteasome beta subunit